MVGSDLICIASVKLIVSRFVCRAVNALDAGSIQQKRYPNKGEKAHNHDNPKVKSKMRDAW